jgi:hypothetical protein
VTASKAAPSASSARGAQHPGEIVIDEVDLNEIAELAKRIERRTP